jgi:nucleoid DNA-binding protein
MNEKFMKSDLIREIASRAQFTQSDTELFLNALEDVIKETIKNQDILNWYGLFKLSVSYKKAHDGWDGIHKQSIKIPETYRVNFTPAPELCHLVDINDEKSNESPIL